MPRPPAFATADADQAGPGVEVDGAERGYARAMRNLGVAYLVGRGVGRDAADAYRWFWLAARHGSAAARLDVEHLEALLDADAITQARLAGLAWERNQAFSGGVGTAPAVTTGGTRGR